MKINAMHRLIFACVAAAGLSACSDDKSDPATAGRDELNPPGKVWTTTQDGKIKLHWTAGNVEDDFKGYYVFATTKADYDAAAVTVGYPKGKTVDLTKSGIPRCVDNTKFFQAFGMAESKRACEADAVDAKTTTAIMLQDDAAAAEQKIAGFVACDEHAGTDPSLPTTSATDIQTCTISKLTLKGGTTPTALVNGTTYGFMVMARMNEAQLSWSSPVIWDTPSKDAASANVTLDPDQYVTIEIDTATAAATISATPVACASGPLCANVSAKNDLTTTKPTLVISRSHNPANTSYPQRLYISAPSAADSAGATVSIQPRGPQTWDFIGKARASRIPNDEATETYPSTLGTKYVVYNNQVFDFQITQGTDKWYGKVVIGDVSYEGATNAGKATIATSVILQPAKNNRHYFQ